MEDYAQGGLADSPPADPGLTSPGTDPGQQSAGDPSQQPPVQSVPYQRFQEVNQRMRQYEQELHQARAWQQQVLAQQQAQQRPAGPQVQLSPEEHAAGQAVAKLLQHHPQLAPLMRMAQLFPAIAQGYGQVSSMAQQQQAARLNAGQAEVARLAGAAGLPQTGEAVRYYESLVAEQIRHMPDGVARWHAGDPRVVADAWQEVQGFLSEFRRPASTGAAKYNTQRLPPAPRGTAPGNAVQRPIGQNGYTLRDAERDMHAAAAAVVRQGLER